MSVQPPGLARRWFRAAVMTCSAVLCRAPWILQDCQVVASAIRNSPLQLQARVEGNEVLVPVPRCARGDVRFACGGLFARLGFTCVAAVLPYGTVRCAGGVQHRHARCAGSSPASCPTGLHVHMLIRDGGRGSGTGTLRMDACCTSSCPLVAAPSQEARPSWAHSCRRLIPPQGPLPQLAAAVSAPAVPRPPLPPLPPHGGPRPWHEAQADDRRDRQDGPAGGTGG